MYYLKIFKTNNLKLIVKLETKLIFIKNHQIMFS